MVKLFKHPLFINLPNLNLNTIVRAGSSRFIFHTDVKVFVAIERFPMEKVMLMIDRYLSTMIDTFYIYTRIIADGGA